MKMSQPVSHGGAMNRVITILGWDVKLQIKHHIYTATIVSTALICMFVVMLPFDSLPTKLAAAFIFSDPALLGMGFIGATVLMEKSSNTLSAIGVTPMPASAYVLSKALSLTLIGFSSGIAVAVVAADGGFNMFMMALSLFLSNSLAVLIGFIIVAKVRSMNELIVRLLVTASVLLLALPAYFGFYPEWLAVISMVLPSYSMLLLFQYSVEPNSLTQWELAYSFGYLLVLILLAWLYSIKCFNESIISAGR